MEKATKSVSPGKTAPWDPRERSSGPRTAEDSFSGTYDIHDLVARNDVNKMRTLFGGNLLLG
jgi:acyl-CoA hydrolase